jgi:hypothetical protein
MHLFAKGKHGTGLGLGDPALDAWPALLEAWLRGRGLLTPDPVLATEMKRILAPPGPRKPSEALSIDHSVPDLLADPHAKAVLLKHLGSEYVEEMSGVGRRYSLHAMSVLDPDHVSAAALAAIESELGKKK